ncbi:MAG TPA: hypothetical protein VFR19_25370 [Hyphomicrobiaceae bacterium]|jgi:hypothetical protein|nr:hypothetical protein [Hyphomicrobiaceae bacterium]
MKRYSIMVVQYGARGESELCQVESDPHAVAKAAAEKMLRVSAGNRMHYTAKYTSVRVIDHEETRHE